jgi:hypothetical protein
MQLTLKNIDFKLGLVHKFPSIQNEANCFNCNMRNSF